MHKIGQEFGAACAMLGINPKQVLKSIGLEHLSGDYGAALWVTPKQISSVYDAFEIESGQDDWYITLANGFASAPLSNICLAMQASESLRDSIYRAGQFKELFEPVEWEVNESGPSLRISVRSLTPDYTFGVKQQVLTFLSLVLLCRNISAKQIVPKRLCVTDAFLHRERVEELVGCSVEIFNKALIEFDRQDVDIPVLSANQDVVKILDAILKEQGREVSRDQSQNFVDQVYAKMLEWLPSGALTADRFAKHFSLSKRTFERRLSDQGSSFKRIKRDCRLRMAQHYLGETRLSLYEISLLLGFNEPNSFYRAYKSWCGDTPMEVREKALNKDIGNER